MNESSLIILAKSPRTRSLFWQNRQEFTHYFGKRIAMNREKAL